MGLQNFVSKRLPAISAAWLNLVDNYIIGTGSKAPNERTAAEIAAAVVPVNFAYPPGYLLRQAANTVPGTTDMQPAFQASIDSASLITPVVGFDNTCGIGKPLLIKSTTLEGISLVGGCKKTSIIQPLATDIKVAAQNINCCIFNQLNNPHLRLEHFRFASAVGFTGVAIYSKESGGNDGSGQVLFSPILRDGFVDFPSTNAGFLQGAMQNATVDQITFENMKGCFIIEGIANSDCHFTNISLFNCFDEFIRQTADTNGSTTMDIRGLNAYAHQRGRLFNVKNWNGATIDGVVLEPVTANLGDTGLFKFTDCVNVVCSNFVAVARTGVPQCAVGIEIAGAGTSQVKFIGGMVDADTGLLISATGTVDIEVIGVDFSNCVTAAVRVNANVAGKLTMIGCKMNSTQATSFLTSVANAMAVNLIDCEILDAGLGGAAGSRNLTFTTSAEVRVVNCKVGRTVGGAAAAFFIDASGSGTVTFLDLDVIGTPPTGLNTGAQAVYLDGLTGTWTPVVGGTATYTTQQGFYKVIENTVHIWGRLTINAIGTGSTININGLPLTSSATYYGGISVDFFSTAANNFVFLTGFIAPGTTQIQLRALTAAAASVTGATAFFGNATDIIFHGSYPLP